MVRLIFFLLGIGLIILGIYFLGNNIIFTTNAYPYWWRGIAADGSILFLTGGVIGLFFLPKEINFLGWGGIIIGIILVFMSSRVILNPTSLWKLFISLVAIVEGYTLLSKGRF